LFFVCIFCEKNTGVGLSLHDVEGEIRRPRRVIHNFSWSGIDSEQGEGRAVRVGALSDVEQYYIFVKDTIEEKIRDTVQDKKQNLKGIMDGDLCPFEFDTEEIEHAEEKIREVGGGETIDDEEELDELKARRKIKKPAKFYKRPCRVAAPAPVEEEKKSEPSETAASVDGDVRPPDAMYEDCLIPPIIVPIEEKKDAEERKSPTRAERRNLFMRRYNENVKAATKP
jgi:hypothetical protein